MNRNRKRKQNRYPSKKLVYLCMVYISPNAKSLKLSQIVDYTDFVCKASTRLGNTKGENTPKNASK